jgi:hypothetical protein
MSVFFIRSDHVEKDTQGDCHGTMEEETGIIVVTSQKQPAKYQ